MRRCGSERGTLHLPAKRGSSWRLSFTARGPAIDRMHHRRQAEGLLSLSRGAILRRNSTGQILG